MFSLHRMKIQKKSHFKLHFDNKQQYPRHSLTRHSVE